MAVCFADTGRAKCYATLSYIDPERGKRSYDCPLRPLPEKHGMLIDGDALMARSGWYNLCGHNRSIHGVQDYEIASMEAIVEAEVE